MQTGQVEMAELLGVSAINRSEFTRIPEGGEHYCTANLHFVGKAESPALQYVFVKSPEGRTCFRDPAVDLSINVDGSRVFLSM